MYTETESDTPRVRKEGDDNYDGECTVVSAPTMWGRTVRKRDEERNNDQLEKSQSPERRVAS